MIPRIAAAASAQASCPECGCAKPTRVFSFLLSDGHERCSGLSSPRRKALPMPQFSTLAEVEAALGDGRLTPAYEVLMSAKMASGDDADRVLSLLEKRGIAVRVSAGHCGDAIASRAERRPS